MGNLELYPFSSIAILTQGSTTTCYGPRFLSDEGKSLSLQNGV